MIVNRKPSSTTACVRAFFSEHLPGSIRVVGVAAPFDFEGSFAVQLKSDDGKFCFFVIDMSTIAHLDRRDALIEAIKKEMGIQEEAA